MVYRSEKRGSEGIYKGVAESTRAHVQKRHCCWLVCAQAG